VSRWKFREVQGPTHLRAPRASSALATTTIRQIQSFIFQVLLAGKIGSLPVGVKEVDGEGEGEGLESMELEIENRQKNIDDSEFLSAHPAG
jgi:hypothetical protein